MDKDVFTVNVWTRKEKMRQVRWRVGTDSRFPISSGNNNFLDIALPVSVKMGVGWTGLSSF